MKKILILTIILITISILSSDLFAQKPERDNRRKDQNFSRSEQKHGMQRHNDRLMGINLKEIDLTDQQKKKIDNLMTAHKKEMIDKEAQVKKLHIDQKSAMDNENFKQAKSISDQIYKIKADISKLRIDHLENIYKELTQEQKEALRNSTKNKRFHKK